MPYNRAIRLVKDDILCSKTVFDGVVSKVRNSLRFGVVSLKSKVPKLLVNAHACF